MQDVKYVLSVTHETIHVMSAESSPILSGAIPAFETFMSKWEAMSEIPTLEPYITPALQAAYTYYGRMDRTRAYIVSMCKHIFSC
jgi:hypothetical protein